MHIEGGNFAITHNYQANPYTRLQLRATLYQKRDSVLCVNSKFYRYLIFLHAVMVTAWAAYMPIPFQCPSDYCLVGHKA